MSKEELEVIDLDKDEIPEKQTAKKNNVISCLLILIGVICIGVALYGLYDSYKNYKEGQDIYNKAEEEFVHVNIPENNEVDTSAKDENTEGTTDVDASVPEVYKGPWYERISVDLAGLQSKYEEVVGWIFFENEEISYPVMQGGDNSKYLTTAYNGAHSNVGSVFVDATHSGDFSDAHTILYAHNLHDMTMFSRLKYYKTKPGYYENHQYFQIFSGDEILRYQIFAYQDVSVDSFIYQENFTSARELSERLMEISMINPGLNIDDDDRIVTLSTCTTDKQHRFVVSAVLVERYNITDKTLIED